MSFDPKIKISIVTPNYNHSSTISSTLESILFNSVQSFDGFTPLPYQLEYHLVDGNSNDSSLVVLSRYAEHFSSFTSEPDTGQYNALNKGFRRCTGEIMGWLNSDDFLCPNALLTVAEIFQAFPAIQWITSLTQLAADAFGRITIVKTLPGICSAAIFDGGYLPGVVDHSYGHIQQESTFWRRSLWDASGGYISECHGLAADYELWHRFAQIAEPIGVALPLGVFRIRAGQASQGQRYVDDLLQLWMKHPVGQRSDLRARLRRKLHTWLPRSLTDRHPRLISALPRPLRYRGQRIVRRNPQGPRSGWKLEVHNFI